VSPEWWRLDLRRVTLPRRYPVEFRQRLLDLLAAGRSIVEFAHNLDVGQLTIFNW
jgi:hypothetical protein